MTIFIQSTIVGFSGNPATIFAGYDEEQRVLVIGNEKEYQPIRKDDSVIMISNDKTIDFDMFFGMEQIEDAITAFYALKNGIALDGESKRLEIREQAIRADPSGSIELDEQINNAGQRYRIQGITNAKIATLSACHYAFYRGDSTQSVDYMFDELNRLSLGYGVTI